MAQLRQDYQEFVERETEVVVVGPDDERAFQDYWKNEDIPFVGLADPSHTVAQRYGQEVRLLRMGRMPALMILDKEGQVQFSHYGGAMHDILPNKAVLARLDELRQDTV